MGQKYVVKEAKSLLLAFTFGGVGAPHPRDSGSHDVAGIH